MTGYLTHSPEETRGLGRGLSFRLKPGDVLALSGELGSGKTTLIQGILAGLGINDRVQSPSFVLVRTYDAGFPVKHVDLYRLDPEAVSELNLEEIYEPGGMMVVEWAERAQFLPGRVSVIKLEFDPADTEKRRITIKGALAERLA